MTIGKRLKDERQRLQLSQPALASIAGVSKSAVISWEKDASSPTATALAALAEAGFDALYIVAGRRTNERPDDALAQIEEDIAAARRDMLEPTRHLLPGEDAERAETRVLASRTNALHAILRSDARFLTPELREEVESLLAIITDPVQLALFRAADHAQHRTKRREMKAQLASWLEGDPYQPGEAVSNLLVTLALEYGVPVKLLVELVDEISEDTGSRPHLGEPVR